MSKKELLFPHQQIRPVQDQLINQVQESLEKKQHCLVHAPTGIGKTAGILAPVLTFAAQKDLTIFFLTPRHTQHKIVINTIKQIQDKHNIKIPTVDLIGKKWMCPVPGTDLLTSQEFSEYCQDVIKKDTCNYYSSFKAKDKKFERNSLYEQLKQINPVPVENFSEIVAKKGFCPYEIATEVAKEARVIIADYHHILNTSIRESLMKRTDKALASSIIIFDEAHNVLDRARDLLTTKITTQIIEFAIKEAHEAKAPEFVKEQLAEIKLIIEALARKIPFEQQESLVEKSQFTFEDYAEFKDNLVSIAEEVREEKKKSFLAAIASFLESWLGPNEGFVRIVKKGFTKSGKPNISLHYNCLDPSLLTKSIIEDSYVTIAMSGTLTPPSMYKDLLGYDNVKIIELTSPFPKQNQLNLIIPGTTTKFTARTPQMYEKIARYCAALANTIPGNTAIFFPSYKLRDEVYHYMESMCKKTTLLEQQGLNKQEKDELLEKFKQYKATGAVLLAAASGNFGEGIDLLGDYLKAVIIVGIPLSKPDIQTNELIKYYDKLFKKGWDYGYLYPAIITSLQNAGRCIRSETDKGVIMFLDERYTWQNYFRCFPKDKHFQITRDPLLKIQEFFNQKRI